MIGNWAGSWGGDWLGGVTPEGNPIVIAALHASGVGSTLMAAQTTGGDPPVEPPQSVPEEPPKYYAIEKPKSDGELLIVQALEEDEMLLAMLHVLVEEL